MDIFLTSRRGTFRGRGGRQFLWSRQDEEADTWRHDKFDQAETPTLETVSFQVNSHRVVIQKKSSIADLSLLSLSDTLPTEASASPSTSPVETVVQEKTTEKEGQVAIAIYSSIVVWKSQKKKRNLPS